jgi:uncharacterized membrane protein
MPLHMTRSADLPLGTLHRHVRLWIALTAGVVLFFLLPGNWGFDSRMLIGWDGGVTLFLAMVYRWMRPLTPAQMSSHYSGEDPSAPLILAVTTAAALLSLLAIIEPLATLRHVEQTQRIWRFALAAVTLVDSWLLVPAMFTMHYADMFYSAPPEDRPLAFPRTEMPSFWDFAYFSFTIAAACQTADISTTQASIRRVVILHEIVSLAFNVAILGFGINITAGLIAG